jgi:putative tryptophan/tyrosine transport system substrate-binding protein
VKRRELIAFLGGTTIAAGRAHAAERVIGWISPESRETTAPFFNAFKAGWQANTPTGGDAVRVIERYVVGGPEALAQQVPELQKEGVGMIVAQGAATLPVVRAKPSVPVVFAFSGDPVVAGIVQSLARPGGDATGVSFMSIELNPKRIDLLRTALPTVARSRCCPTPAMPAKRTTSLPASAPSSASASSSACGAAKALVRLPPWSRRRSMPERRRWSCCQARPWSSRRQRS